MFLLCQSLTGCNKEVQREKTEEVLGTIITVKVYTDKGDAPLEAAFERAKELEMLLSANNADSELSQMNQKAYSEEVKVSDELFFVVKKGIYYGELTNGAIDISIGKLIDLWGIGTELARVPKETELAPYIGQNGYKNIELNKEKRTIHFLDKNVQVNLGAIAKGYIADEMKKVLVEEYGVQHAMLSLGGNIIVIGDKADGSKWNVGIADPLDPQSVKASLSITDKTIVTSGNYERYFEQDERSCFKVFYDSELTRPVDINVNDEGSKNRTTISPNRIFSYKETNSEGTWGSHTKFWLLQYVD